MSSEITPEDIYTWEIKKLWNTFKTIDRKQNEDYIVRHGERIKVPIWYFTEEWYELYPYSHKVKIQGYGKFMISDFMEEKEKREDLMRETIINALKKGTLIIGRITGE